MRVNKIIGLLLITTSLYGASTIANANDLKFGNNSKYNISFSINNVCSKELGGIEQHTIKTIDQSTFDEVCKYSPHQCAIDVYTKENCTGKSVANMVFDNTNIISISSAADIMIAGNGSNVFFNNL